MARAREAGAVVVSFTFAFPIFSINFLRHNSSVGRCPHASLYTHKQIPPHTHLVNMHTYLRIRALP